MPSIKYENATYHTYGELPAIGSRAPDVSLVNTKLQNVSLANWLGIRKIMNIVLSIDTDGCAKSVIEFDRRASNLSDVVVFSVSYDLPFAYRRFQEKNELKNIIGLSAIRHEGFGENYGVQITEGPFTGMFSRAVVVLDENNTVVHQQHLEDLHTEPDYDAAFRALGIKSDED